MSLREQLRKAAGLFVELPAEPEVSADVEISLEDPPGAPAPALGAQTVAQLLKNTDGPALEEISVPTPPTAPVIAPGGGMNFTAIYQQAALPATPFPTEQMLDLLNSLPAELSLDTRRQTVKVTLNGMGKALGVTPQTVVADATRKLAALNAYVESLAKHTTDYIAATEQEIATLEAQIATKRHDIDIARQQQTSITANCGQEADRIDDVLEFFSLDVPPSKYAAGDSQK